METFEITGPAAWASYFVNGDASGLDFTEKLQADAWLKREGVEILGVEGEPFFTWAFDVYAPETGFRGGEVVKYLARALTYKESA